MTQSIYHEIQGDGAREIIICNGLSQTTANWRGIARQNPQFRWLLFDARGHGKSLVQKRPYALDDHVEDLLSVMEKEAREKPVLIGFSHGARVALRAAAEFGDRFKALILISCGSKRTAKRKAYVRSWEECLKLGGVRAMAWASIPAIVGRKILEKFPDLEFLIRGSAARNNKEGLLAVFEGMADYPEAQQDAKRVKIPSLILHGGEDPLVGPEDVADLRRWIADSVSQTFEDCGHTLPLEEPRRFVTSIERFLDQTA